MSGFFGKKAEAEPITGRDLLRQALFNRLHKGALPVIASNIPGIGLSALENFARGGSAPTPEILSLLAKELYGGHVELNPASGMLRSVNREPVKSGGVRPPQFDPSLHPPVPRTASMPAKPVMSPMPVKTPPPGWE
jgi:hypothetical protein